MQLGANLWLLTEILKRSHASKHFIALLVLHGEIGKTITARR